MVRPGAINTISVRRLAILGLLRLRLTVLLAVLRIRWGVRHISLGYDAGKLGELGVGRRALAITSSFLPRTGCQCFSLRRRFGWGVASGRISLQPRRAVRRRLKRSGSATKSIPPRAGVRSPWVDRRCGVPHPPSGLYNIFDRQNPLVLGVVRFRHRVFSISGPA